MENKFQTPSKNTQKENLTQKPLVIPPSPYVEKLGYGTGVTVWKLQPSPKNNCVQSPWAIKNVRKNVDKLLSSKYQSLLNNEADILKSLDHENIVSFKGYIKSEDGRECLAMEMGGKSLGNMIETRCEEGLGPFPAKDILKVAFNVAKALQYLHDEKKILHGDIKSYNIVIKNDFKEVKLCDFGVSFSLNDENLKEKFVGTKIYSAPECQEGVEGPITAKADIFSFGLVLWEMISLYPPHVQDMLFESFDSEMSESDFEDSQLFLGEALEQNYGTRPPLPPIELGLEYAPILEIFCCCTEQNIDKRPSASELVKWLETLIKS